MFELALHRKISLGASFRWMRKSTSWRTGKVVDPQREHSANAILRCGMIRENVGDFQDRAGLPLQDRATKSEMPGQILSCLEPASWKKKKKSATNHEDLVDNNNMSLILVLSRLRSSGARTHVAAATQNAAAPTLDKLTKGRPPARPTIG